MRKATIALALLALSAAPPPAKVVTCSITMDGLVDVFTANNQLRMVLPRVLVFDSAGGFVTTMEGYNAGTTEAIRRATSEHSKPKATRIEDFAANLRTDDGQSLDTRPLHGKATVFELGAEWCQPCRVLEPELRRLTGVNVVLVDADTRKHKEEFAEALKKRMQH